MTQTLKPYSSYKDNSEMWLGKIPSHWELIRTKTILKERIQKGYPDETLLAATQTKGVVRKELYENRTVTAQKDLELLKLVKVGDFVISLRSFQGGIEYAREQGIISPAYTVLHAINSDFHGFLAHLFKSKPYIENLSVNVTGIRQGQNVDYERLSRTKIPLPPLSEQTAIVRYLNYMDRRINRYINAKKKLIELLNEQKQAIIHQAVARGLNPNVRLKASGIEWLGDIPEHWHLSRMKNEFKCLDRQRIPISGMERGTMTLRKYDYYGASGIIDKVDGYLFDDELLLIAEDGANLLLRNLPLAIIAHGQYWVNNHAHILKPRHGNIEYLADVLETLNYSPWISGAAQPKLTQDRFMAINIAVPNLEDQNKIIKVIQREVEPLELAIGHAKHEITLLREYRSRLISDMVTGKLDVRDVAAGLPDEIEETADDTEIELPGDSDLEEQEEHADN